jgi:FMN reductase
VTKIVGISGSASLGSKTRAVVEATIGRVAERAGGKARLIAVADLVPDLGIAARTAASLRLEEALRLIERADLVIAGSPVYKGSYTGLFKHLIDFVDYRALAGVPVGLIATGGGDRHALVVEHQLRPLFAFFTARILPTAVFISDRAITESGAITDGQTGSRLDQLIDEAVGALADASHARLAAV